MTPMRRLLTFFVYGSQFATALSFGPLDLSNNVGARGRLVLRQSLISGVVDAIEEVEKDKRRDQLKRTIVQLGASYDRGFGASPRVRSKMDEILVELEGLNQEENASRFIDGPELTKEVRGDKASIHVNGRGGGDNAISGNETSSSTLELSPLTGNWRMVWTTAQDVLVLGASPVASVGAIYQFISPPSITNVIDFMPRFQNFFPSSVVPNSMLRAEVSTKASSRKNNPNRIGLLFERVEFRGKELLGQDVSKMLPPLALDLPRMELSDDVGYFDVAYLDKEILVIRQNSPGGCFVLVNVDNDTDP